MLARRDVAASILDDHLQFERHVIGERGQHEVLVDHFNRVVGDDVGTRDRPLGAPLDPNHTRGIAVILDHQALHGEHDVGHVLKHTLDGGELVKGARQFDLGDGTALETRQQHTPQAVANGRAKASLEWLGDELAIRSRKRLLIGHNRAGQLEATPTNMHAELLLTTTE